MTAASPAAANLVRFGSRLSGSPCRNPTVTSCGVPGCAPAARVAPGSSSTSAAANGGRSFTRSLAETEPWIQGVAEAIAYEVDRHHGDEDRSARKGHGYCGVAQVRLEV